MATITLLPNQGAHVQKLQSILDTHKFAFDFSMLGTGKTYTSSFIALQNKFAHVIVVCPLSVAPKWKLMKTMGVPVHTIVTFCSLRSIKNKQPKHGLLRRDDYTRFETEEVTGVLLPFPAVRFFTTPAYDTMLTEKTLLVIDEIQNFKNASAQFEACKTMIGGVLRSETSRVLLLSGSPIDKEEHALQLFRAIGVFKRDRIARFDIQQRMMVLEGLKEIQDFCKVVSPDAYATIPAPQGSGIEYTKHAYRLFQSVVRTKIASAMSAMPTEFLLDKKNGYYRLPANREALLRVAVTRLEHVIAFDPDNGNANFQARPNAFGPITLALQAIENAKLHIFKRVVRAALLENPSQKVVVCVNYSASIVELCAALAEFTPLVLEGKTSVGNRASRLEKFQRPDLTHRLLIGNVSVCSTGIDLDDKDGRFPRVCFVNPNYSTINLYQLSHRFMRADTKSSSRIVFVYGAVRPELRVLNALAKKSGVMKETTPEQVAAGIVFPVDMETFVEPPIPEFQRIVVDERNTDFVRDNQNVHTTLAMKFATDTFNKITVNVPPPTQHTLEEILAQCGLTNPAQERLRQCYYTDEVYGIKSGFKRMLDSVWAFANAHPDKTNLLKCVKTELEQNVGMCLQGCFTRVANIVGGYIEGVEVVSATEKLQAIAADIAGDNQDKKKERLEAAMLALDVPVEEWKEWTDALE